MSRIVVVRIAILIVITILFSLLIIHSHNTNNSNEEWSVPPQVSVFFPENNTILMVSVDEFLSGCLRGMISQEQAPSPEGLSAVACAMKTQILYRLKTDKGYDADTNSADFAISENFPYTRDNGNAELNTLLRTAVENSSPLTIDGELFDCRLCRISAGLTDAYEHSPSLPLLCDSDGKGYTCRLAFSSEEVWRIMKPYRAPSDCTKWFTNAVYKPTGTLETVEFCSIPISGEELRKRFNLPSQAITVEYSDDSFYFNCKGIGDNQGLSVNTAFFLAQSGYSTEEILRYFYPTADTHSLSEKRNNT